MEWRLQGDVIDSIYRKKISDFVLSTNRFTQDAMVRKFENNFSKWSGAEYSLFVSSGSTANLLLIDAMKEKYHWGSDAEIIVPAVTWTTNVSPIIQLGMTPVFCDINLEDLSFDYDMLSKLITHKTKAIFITHLIGLPADISLINNICSGKDIKIIEDCCESQGAQILNKKVGNFGDGGTFSFYWGHHMTSIEGGMVITNDKDLFCIMRMKRSHGMARELPESEWKSVKSNNMDNDFRFLFLTLGYNFRNSEINAFIGNLQLKDINKIIEKRNSNYMQYLKLVSQYNFIKMIYKNGMSSFCLPLVFNSEKQKNIAQTLLERSEIESRPLISGNLLRHPAYSKYKGNINYKNSDMLGKCALYIGNHQFVSEKNFATLDKVLHEISVLV